MKVEQLCSDLIKVESYSGNEGQVVEKLKVVFKDCGFDDVEVDKYGNVIGKIIGNKPGKKILFDAHIDTVEAEEEKWKLSPFSGEIKNGKVYGRGASDMKGALAAMIIAGKNIVDTYGKDFPGEIYVAGVVHEECFEGVSAREISKNVKPDYVIIGEASQLNVKIGQRGRGEIKVETFGVPAHSANPEKGINAVLHMGMLMSRIEKIVAPEQPVLGKGILALTDIKSDPYPGASVIPHHCMATYDRRLLVGETIDTVLAPIQEIIDEMSKEIKGFKGKVSIAKAEEMCHTGNKIYGERFFPGWLYEDDSDYVQKVVKGLNDNGINSEISYYSFCTNGSHYAGEAGIKTLGFGPSKENIAHTIDEYIEIEQLEKAVIGNEIIAKALLGF